MANWVVKQRVQIDVGSRSALKGAHPKCMYRNTEVPIGQVCKSALWGPPCSVSTLMHTSWRLQELKVCMQLQGYDLTGNTEMQRVNKQLKAAKDGYRLYRKDRPGW